MNKALTTKIYGEIFLRISILRTGILRLISRTETEKLEQVLASSVQVIRVYKVRTSTNSTRNVRISIRTGTQRYLHCYYPVITKRASHVAPMTVFQVLYMLRVCCFHKVLQCCCQPRLYYLLPSLLYALSSVYVNVVSLFNLHEIQFSQKTPHYSYPYYCILLN